MEHQPDGGKALIRVSVQRVAEDRRPQVAHVHAQLVSASRARPQRDQRVAGVLPQHAVESDCQPAARPHTGEALPVAGVAAQQCLDPARRGRQLPFHNGDVPLLRRARPELGCQVFEGARVLRHDDDARGVLVQPVDDAGPRLAGAEGLGKPRAVPQHRVHEGPRPVAAAGVHHHALGLVDDEGLGILVQDGKGDLLGREGEGRGIGPCHPHGVARLQPPAESGCLAVHLGRHHPCPDLAAREQPHAVGDEHVQPDPGGILVPHHGLSGVRAAH